MAGFFAAAGRWITKIESWWAFMILFVQTSLFHWIGSQWDLLASQGWAAVFLVAIMCTSALTIAACLGYLTVLKVRTGNLSPDQLVPSATLTDHLEPNYDAWKQIDPLTIHQAACLWAEIEPTGHFSDAPEQARARLLMLTQAVQNNRLEADRNFEMASTPGHPSHVVCQKDLVAFAEEIDDRPRFLFPEERKRRH